MNTKSLALFGNPCISSFPGIATTQTDTTEQRLAWFQDIQFGMFIEHETRKHASSGHKIIKLKVAVNAPDERVSMLELVVSGEVSVDQKFM
ncbi:hypothetical protein [Rhodopirellula sp. SWK7]|uniref:hypothetical protein n=1 Tax=Rhodopirellula sp. SWK7 TaxID=595460 RepID=UPI0002BF42F4|nr:hypothetical protein [Rhodopirellula sp. SWK7]EMI43330.1 secreted protein [Rhodopirellula sp. SWK7]